MVDKEMLEAISLMMDSKLEAIREEMKQIKAETVQESTHNMKILLETEVQSQLKLLAEGHQSILDRLPDLDEMEKMQQELDQHHTMISLHTNAIQDIRRKLRRAE